MSVFYGFENSIKTYDTHTKKDVATDNDIPDDIRSDVYEDELPDDARLEVYEDELPDDTRLEVYEDELPDDVRPDVEESELPNDVRVDEKAIPLDNVNEAQENGEPHALTDQEQQNLKDTLGWTDKQIAKCTIYAEGTIYYRTDREDMEGKTGANGVPYIRKRIVINGVVVEGIFPVFNSKFDVQLPKELEKSSNPKQFKECNQQLKEAIENNPDLRSNFTKEQIEDIRNGDTPEGCVWHHNEEEGKMQLVNTKDHDRTQGGAAHTGGKALWGGV